MVDVGDDCNVSQIFSDHNILLPVLEMTILCFVLGSRACAIAFAYDTTMRGLWQIVFNYLENLKKMNY